MRRRPAGALRKSGTDLTAKRTEIEDSVAPRGKRVAVEEVSAVARQ